MTGKQVALFLVGAAIGTAIVLQWAGSTPPTTLTERQKQIITQKVGTEILAAQLLYGLPELHRPSVGFSVSDPRNSAESLCAQRMVVDGVPAWSIRVNEPIAAQHWHAFLRDDVPHEVAHLIACQLNLNWRNHDDSWASIVRDAGATPSKFHHYERQSP